jgi:hypothetical protein
MACARRARRSAWLAAQPPHWLHSPLLPHSAQLSMPSAPARGPILAVAPQKAHMTSGRALRRGAPAVLLRLRGPPLVLALALALALLLVLPLGPATALAAAGARSARRRFEARTGSKTRLAGDTSELTSCRGRARQPDAARGRRARHDARSHRRRSPGRRTRCPRRTADGAHGQAPASQRTALLAP